MVGAAIRGDDEVGVEVGGDRLDEDVDDSVLALAAGGVADDPAHGIAGRDGDELFAGLQADVGDLIDGGIELIERAARVGIDLDGIDVAILAGLDAGGRAGRRRCAPWGEVEARSLRFFAGGERGLSWPGSGKGLGTST